MKKTKMDERHLAAHRELWQLNQMQKRLGALRAKIQQSKIDIKCGSAEYSEKIQLREKTYEKYYEETEESICETEKILRLLPAESGNILRDYYINRKTLEEMAYKLPCGFRTICRLKLKALLEYYNIKKGSL